MERGGANSEAIMNGDKKIGVSIMKIEKKLDSGPICASKEFELDKNETHGEIEKKLSLEGANLLNKIIRKLLMRKK